MAKPLDNFDNPYASPRPDALLPEKHESPRLIDGVATARIIYTTDYLMEALARFHAQHGSRFSRLFLRILILVALAVFAAASFWQRQYGFGVFFTILTIAVASSRRMVNRATRRGFASSPHFNEELTIQLSDAGFDSESHLQSSRLRWSMYQKVVYFDDGYLLLQGPVQFNWLRMSAFVEGTDFQQLESLLRSHIPQHVDRRRKRRS